jgi:hypothetical protein
MKLPHLLVVSVCSTLFALGACTYAPPPNGVVMMPNPYPTVPPPIAEQRPLPPVSEDPLVWRPGEWEWASTGYVWRPGRYEALAGHSNQYLPGHWAPQGTNWVWQGGHWL